MDHRFLPVALLTLCMVGAFCAVLYHVTRMVFGRASATGPLPAFPRSYALALFVAFVPVVLLGVSLPASVEHLLRLAAMALAR